MDPLVLIFLTLCVTVNTVTCVSTKLDFGEDVEETPPADNLKSEDENIQVEHTVVLKTNLKNNNRRGITSKSNGDTGTLHYHIGTEKLKKEDSGEVPIVPGYKAVDTTKLYTPDTRHKNKMYPDAFFVSKNIRDENDLFPTISLNPLQWKPSSFFNNINWRMPDGNGPYNYRPKILNGIHRKLSEAGVRDFYCKKCRELSQPGPPVGTGCVEKRQNSWFEATTSKIKLDGKLAKLN